MENQIIIRTGPWFFNKGINLNQNIIDESVKKLELEKCPVCESRLSYRDNFGNPLPREFRKRFGYCPKDDHIIEFSYHQYEGNTFGTTLSMKIHTNSKFSELLADSGELADIKGKHIQLLV